MRDSTSAEQHDFGSSSPTPSRAEGARAMEGLRVLDLGTFIAGPHTASIFAEFGAEVLKIEHPVAGDPLRRFGSATEQPNRTLAFLSEARNRRSVTLDLRKPRGVELFLELVAQSDVLIENFRPGRMEQWGLGWDVLQEANPGLIFLRVSGYGQTGPYREPSAFSHIARTACSPVWPRPWADRSWRSPTCTAIRRTASPLGRRWTPW